jgi:hypothetical protein
LEIKGIGESMSLESHKVIEIIQYIVFSGLLISGAAVLLIKDFRKKMIFSFLLFILLAVVAFVFYSGTLFIIAGAGYVFVFILLYLLAGTAGCNVKEAYPANSHADKKQINAILKKPAMIIAPILLCSVLGYLVYGIAEGYLHETERTQEISINGMEQVSAVLFTDYNIMILLLISALPVLFIWLTVMLAEIKNRGKVH